MELHLLLQWHILERVPLLRHLRTIHTLPPRKRNLPEQHVMLLSHRRFGSAFKDRPILRVFLCCEHHVHIR